MVDVWSERRAKNMWIENMRGQEREGPIFTYRADVLVFFFVIYMKMNERSRSI
jgi:hypothetical protein